MRDVARISWLLVLAGAFIAVFTETAWGSYLAFALAGLGLVGEISAYLGHRQLHRPRGAAR